VAKDSVIEWTHHTFNPWWGCVKLSPACAHCYAETWARRFGDELWGGDAPRRFFSEHHWREPLRWNSEAKKQGIRARVFCASMADVFEPRTDLDPWREKLWALIEKTPHLDWLLLTKRPGHIKNVYPWAHDPRENVWLGTTAENQRWATRRIERLIAVDAHVRFLSCEPLLSAVDLRPGLKKQRRRKRPRRSADAPQLDSLPAGSVPHLQCPLSLQAMGPLESAGPRCSGYEGRRASGRSGQARAPVVEAKAEKW
jgi:protein gp37